MNDVFGNPIKKPSELVLERDNNPKLTDWLNDLCSKKNDLRSIDSSLKSFDSFIIVKGLGQRKRTCTIANLMNQLAHIPKEAQYLFFLYGIPKKNDGFEPWPKNTDDKRIKLIMDKCHVNKYRAKEVLMVLNENEITQLLGG